MLLLCLAALEGLLFGRRTSEFVCRLVCLGVLGVGVEEWGRLLRWGRVGLLVEED